MGDYLLQAEHISFTPQGQTVLNDVSLTIEPGEFVTLIGPNGAGKSSLLKVLLGITKPNKGRVLKRNNLSIGYTPQRTQAHTAATLPITVKRFLQLGKSVDAEAIVQVLAEVQADSLTQKMLYHLSGGELQRVLLARALLAKPELLILDEPTQNLDVTGEMAFYELIENIRHKRQCSVLMVSHNLHRVMKSSNRIICLYHHVCCTGKPEMISKDPKFTEMFGDEARLVGIYQHRHDHKHEC